MTKSPKVSYEEKEMTVGDTLRWLDKLEKVTSKGAKLAMVSMLLRRVRKDTLEAVKRGLVKRKIDYSYVNIPEEYLAEPDNIEAEGYNQAIDEVLSLISGMKGGKE